MGEHLKALEVVLDISRHLNILAAALLGLHVIVLGGRRHHRVVEVDSSLASSVVAAGSHAAGGVRDPARSIRRGQEAEG